MAYNFYGWETADIKAITDEYKGIVTPKDLYDMLLGIWSERTCAPRMRGEWSIENPTLGQCSITAFLAQDIFGGKVYGVPLGDGNYHCYNVVGDCVFDLTSEQFGVRKLCYENNPEQLREEHFAKEEKRLRYEYLRSELKKFCDYDPAKWKEMKIDGIIEVPIEVTEEEALDRFVAFVEENGWYCTGSISKLDTDT